MREGGDSVVLEYLSSGYSRILECPQIPSSGTVGYVIHRYSRYLKQKVEHYSSTGVDYARMEPDYRSLKKLTTENGLLGHVDGLLVLIKTLLRCNFTEETIRNDLMVKTFRMLVSDLLVLFGCLNEGVISILGKYFEMAKRDASRALDIYKDFGEIVEDVSSYLKVARDLEYLTKLDVPEIKYASTDLTRSLEDYLHDPNFEENRKQYISKKNGTTDSNSHSTPDVPIKSNSTQRAQYVTHDQQAVSDPVSLPTQQSIPPNLSNTNPFLSATNSNTLQQVSSLNDWGFHTEPQMKVKLQSDFSSRNHGSQVQPQPGVMNQTPLISQAWTPQFQHQEPQSMSQLQPMQSLNNQFANMNFNQAQLNGNTNPGFNLYNNTNPSTYTTQIQNNSIPNVNSSFDLYANTNTTQTQPNPNSNTGINMYSNPNTSTPGFISIPTTPAVAINNNNPFSSMVSSNTSQLQTAHSLPAQSPFSLGAPVQTNNMAQLENYGSGGINSWYATTHLNNNNY